MSDYLELWVDEYGDDRQTVLAYKGRELVCSVVQAFSVIRHHGVWSIAHEFSQWQAVTYIPADGVTHFTMVSPEQAKGYDAEATENRP